jgi:hypothetical protein
MRDGRYTSKQLRQWGCSLGIPKTCGSIVASTGFRCASCPRFHHDGTWKCGTHTEYKDPLVHNVHLCGTCSICLEDFVFIEQPLGGLAKTTTTACGHTFHTQCVEVWTKTMGKSTCPLCRSNVALSSDTPIPRTLWEPLWERGTGGGGEEEEERSESRIPDVSHRTSEMWNARMELCLASLPYELGEMVAKVRVDLYERGIPVSIRPSVFEFPLTEEEFFDVGSWCPPCALYGQAHLLVSAFAAATYNTPAESLS